MHRVSTQLTALLLLVPAATLRSCYFRAGPGLHSLLLVRKEVSVRGCVVLKANRQIGIGKALLKEQVLMGYSWRPHVLLHCTPHNCCT